MRPTLTPSLIQELYTPPLPADVLRQLGYRTASMASGTLEGVLTYGTTRYNPMHYFVGTLGINQFVLQRLEASGRGYVVQLSSARRVSVTGQLHACAGGRWVVLRYKLSALSVPLSLIGLLIWFYQQLTERPLGYALLRLVLVAGLVLWVAFWLEMHWLRAQLTDSLQLQPKASV